MFKEFSYLSTILNFVGIFTILSYKNALLRFCIDYFNINYFYGYFIYFCLPIVETPTVNRSLPCTVVHRLVSIFAFLYTQACAPQHFQRDHDIKILSFSATNHNFHHIATFISRATFSLIL